MSLQDWLKNNWLVKHRTSAEEIASLLAIVERDLSNSQVAGLSTDWRLNIAYNAALQAAFAARAKATWARLMRKVYEADLLECPQRRGRDPVFPPGPKCKKRADARHRA